LISNGWAKNVRLFHQYYLKNPAAKKGFNESILTPISFYNESFNITNLTSSTCYFIELYVCTQNNILLCDIPAILLQKTKDLVVHDPFYHSIFLKVSIITAVLLPLIVITQYLHSLYKYKKDSIDKLNQKKSDEEFELTDKWEIERERIVQVKFLGNGEFGRVFEGYIKPFDSQSVAVKTLIHCSETYEENFRREAQSMKKFNAHHVVKLINYVMETRPLLVVMELMKYGDLKKFLQKNRPVDAQKSKCQNSESGYIVATTAPLHKIRPVHEMAIEIADGKNNCNLIIY
jgi:Protein tyrosine and serine/threonine kinase